MHDVVIKGGTIVDGAGSEPYTADIAFKDGRISDIGKVTEPAKETLIAWGALVTPGFIDIHTHYDGQATWDETFVPSVFHGVSTVVMGNCGVGFAPLVPGHEQKLIELMEGVEDIPGAALAEGVRFNWRGFGDYMNMLDAMPHTLDYLVQVPHDCVRMAVMGERASAHQAASEQEIVSMRNIVREALLAGAVGFSTGRTDNHRTARGQETPASEADAMELCGIAEAFSGLNHGVIQLVSDFDLFRGADRFDAEFDLVELMARTAGRPMSMTWLQRDPGGEQYRRIAQRVEAANSRRLPLFLQTAARGIGVIIGLDASFHPFMGFASYKEISSLPLAQRVAALRDADRRARVLSERSERVAGDGSPVPPLVDLLLAQIDRASARMFPLEGTPNYAPKASESFYARATRQGSTALAAIYDYLCEGDGSRLIYFPIFNYNEGSLDVVGRMLQHSHALLGLSDAGAHVGTICDASFTTFMLTHWVRDTGRMKLEHAVRMMTRRNAAYLGLKDRGVLKVGLRADVNVIDLKRLSLPLPQLRRDLPGGGRRFVQNAQGYMASYVNGQCVQREGQVLPARPGRLVRAGQAAPEPQKRKSSS
jgi:N-acyl-D-aspartate/D-glutamate deacylase